MHKRTTAAIAVPLEPPAAHAPADRSAWPASVFCPTCGEAGPVVPVVYGMPVGGDALWARSERGEAVIGGCMPEPWDWACARAGHRLSTPGIDWAWWGREEGTTAEEARAWWEANEREEVASRPAWPCLAAEGQG